MIEELSLRVASRSRCRSCCGSSRSAPATAACWSRKTRRNREARLENLNELMNAAAEAVERGETVRDFLDHAALVAEADAIDEHAQITLMTMHNAKGLEFPVVFLAGMEDGLFPHSRSIDVRGRRWKRSGGSATWA